MPAAAALPIAALTLASVASRSEGEHRGIETLAITLFEYGHFIADHAEQAGRLIASGLDRRPRGTRFRPHP